MSTYAEVTRADLEDFLDSTGLSWYRKEDTAGVYLLCVSPKVAIRLSSTLKGDGSECGVACGGASMKLDLVSRLDGTCLNRKASKQSRYHRTLQWQKNWGRGVKHWEKVYADKADFYDRIAQKRKDLAMIDAQALRDLYKNTRALARQAGMINSVQVSETLNFITQIGRARVAGNPLKPWECVKLSYLV